MRPGNDIQYAGDVLGYIEENGLIGIEDFLRKKLEEWKDIEINISVTGGVGAGKSSFINALRGRKDDDEDAAKTGVTETTKKALPYSHPTNKKIKFLDLPGIGTPSYPDLKTYCAETGLEKYDTFLIFTAGRFTENNLKLAREVKSLGKSFFFVRNKIDQDIDNEKRKRAFNEKSTLDLIRKDCLNKLGDLAAGDKDVFLISTRNTEGWDFDLLRQAILDALPYRQKECLTLSFDLETSRSKHLVKRKVDVLRDRVWKVAAASGAGAVVPIPGLSVAIDLGLLTQEVNFYRFQLRLPDESSEEFHNLTPGLRDQISKFFLTSAVQFGQLATAYAVSSNAEEYTRYIPFVGSVIAGSISFTTTYNFLHGWLNELEETALKILDEIKPTPD